MRLPETGSLAATQSDEQFMASRQLLRYLRAAMDVGARMPVLLDAVGVDESDLRNPTVRVPESSLMTLIRAAQKEIRDPLALYKMGKAAVPQGFSDLHYGPLFMPDLAQLMEKNVEMQNVARSGMRTKFEKRKNDAVVMFTTASGNADLPHEFAELTLSLYLYGARQIGLTDARFEYIELTCDQPDHAKLIEEWVGSPVHFNAPRNLAIIGNDTLYAPLPQANRCIVHMYEQMILGIIHEKSSLLRAIQIYLLEEMDKTPVTLVRTAYALGMTERTLRRRIQEEGSSFRHIIDELRKQLCRLYLAESTRSIEEIAQRLGYSETSAFTRAHLRWHGTPPSRAGNI